MTKRKYNYESVNDLSEIDYDYISSVSATEPEYLSIEEINDFLNEMDYFLGDKNFISEEDFLKDFDDYDMNDIMRGLN